MSFGLGSASGEIRITYDGAGVQQAIGDLGRLQQASGNIGEQLTKVGGLAVGAGAAIGLPLIGAVNAAADFEQQMDAVSAALGGVPLDVMSTLEQQALDLGAATKFSAGEVAGVQEVLGKAGIDSTQLLDGATQAVLDLSAASGEELTPSAEAAASAVNLFGLSGEQLTGVADTFTVGLNNSNASLTDFQRGINNLGPVMANLERYAQDPEQAFTDTAAAVAYFNAQGLKAADAGVSLARGMTNLADPTSDATATLEALGVSAFDANGNFLPLPDLFDQLNASMAGMSDQAREQALATIFGAEAADVMNIAIKKGGDGLREYEALMESSGQAAEQAAIRQDNLRGALEQLGGALETAAIALGTGLLDPIRSLADALQGLVQAFIGLSPEVQKFIATFAALSAILLTVGGGALLAAGQILKLAQAFSAVGLSLGKLALGLGLVGLALGAGILAYQTNFLGFADIVNGALDKAGKAISAFAKGFSASFNARTANGINQVSAAIGAFGDALLTATGIDITGFTENLADGIDAALTSFQTAIDQGFTPVAAALTGLAAAAQAIGLDGLSSGLIHARDAAEEFGTSFQAAFGDAQAMGDPAIVAGIRAIGTALSNVLGVDVTGFFGKIADAAENLGNAIGNLASAIQEKLAQALSFVQSNVVPGVISALGNLLGTIRDVGTELLSGDFSQAGQILGDAIQSLSTWASDVANAVSNVDWGGVASSIASGIGDALGNLASVVSGLLGGINWGEVVSAVGTALAAAFSAISSFLTTIAGAIASALGDALGGVASRVGAINWGDVVSAVGTALGSAFATAGDFLGTVGAAVGSALTNALNTVGEFLGGINTQAIVQTVSDALAEAFSTAGDFLGTVGAAVGSALTNALNTIGDFLGGLDTGSIVQTVSDALVAAFNIGGDWLSGVASAIGSALGSALGTIGNFLGAIDLSGVVSAVTNAITAAFGGSGGGGAPAGLGGTVGQGGGFSSIAQSIGSALGSALGTIGNFLGALEFSTVVSDVVSKIESAFAAGGTFDLSAMGQNLINAINEACGVDLSSAFDTLGEAAQGVGRALSVASAAISGAISAIKATLEGIDFSTVFDALGQAAQGVGSAMAIASSAVTGAIRTIQDALANVDFAAVFDTLGEVAGNVGRAMGVLSAAVTGSMSTIADAISKVDFSGIFDAANELAGSLPGALEGILGAVTDWASKVVAKLGEIKDAVAGAFSGLSPDESTVASVEASLQESAKRNLAGLESDQALQALGTSGDFATNFINNVASSFAQADWSPVSNAMTAGLNSALSGGFAGQGGPRDVGPSEGAGIGSTFVTSFIQQIVAAFTPEAFAPVKAAFDAALTAAMGAVGEGAKGGAGAASAATTMAQQFMTEFGAAIGQNTGIVVAAVQAAMTTVGTAIATGAAQWMAEFTNAFTNIQTVVTNGMTTVTTAITTGMTSAQTAVTTAIAGITASFTAFASEATAAGTTAGTGFSTGLQTGLSAAAATAAAMVAQIIATLNSAAAGAQAAGAAVGEGFAAGMEASLSRVQAAAAAMADAAAQGLASAAQIASPSKVTMALGEEFGLGFALGIAGETTRAGIAANSVAQEAIRALTDRLAAQEHVRGASSIAAADQIGKWNQHAAGLMERQQQRMPEQLEATIVLDDGELGQQVLGHALVPLFDAKERRGRRRFE